MAYTAADVERRVAEPEKAARLDRSPYERDRARVLHSAALRRLAAKTQVVGVGVDDFPRTRLTHSLECAQIGRELGAALGADPDLVDAACLAHDLGHPPYGHNGERALDEAARACGGFEGNAQSLRILVRLEAKVLDGDGRSAGLNLTRAVLDAATKYPWPRSDAPPTGKYGVYDDDRDAFDWFRDGAPKGERCLEAQVMDWADDVAYSVHDLEDGVHAGQVDVTALGDLDGLAGQPWWPRRYDGTLRAQAALKRMTSELIARFCTAALDATRQAYGPGLRRYDASLVVPERARAECALLKAVAEEHVMLRREALDRQVREREMVAELVAALLDRAPDSLEPLLRNTWYEAAGDNARLRVVVDQVAGWSDTAAARAHAALVRPAS